MTPATRRPLRTFSSAVILTTLLSLSCASVPPESVELSTVVGQRISAVQASHENFLSLYFRLTRERIEDFLERRWIPHFLATFVQDANLVALLESPESSLSEAEEARLREELTRVAIQREDQEILVRAVTSALGDSERGQIVLEFAEAAITQIEDQRRELLEPLARQEEKALSSLRASYAELIAMQNVVTAHLSSVRRVTVAQDEVLERLGVLERRDRAVEEAVALNDTVVSLIDRAEGVERTVEDIRRALGVEASDEEDQ